ncbi:nitrous oxide reductase accessory protein NosL [Halobacteria archaeon AArc-curdl1]|uniref:Nitrous oxide reductase accessory protein NosL n=1 Tax=Natronosalvus hydrolyticus TaxID=2979988 RepID=A0AAP3E878_9EURY|nr:nitrous oxide reductase accessory protein NosL [Halobacteria archaeon AArc-curdl1]
MAPRHTHYHYCHEAVSCTDQHQLSGLSRRRFLAGTAIATTTGLAGCLGDDDEDAQPAEPIALTGGRECAVCGMVIEDHYGPAGQVFYEDDDEPVVFDSLTELLVYHDEQRQRGTDARGVFVTDYSSVDYDLEEQDGSPYISTHAEREAFADAMELFYLVDSEIQGAMGADHVPFSSREDAEALREDVGGDILEWDDL